MKVTKAYYRVIGWVKCDPWVCSSRTPPVTQMELCIMLPWYFQPLEKHFFFMTPATQEQRHLLVHLILLSLLLDRCRAARSRAALQQSLRPTPVSVLLGPLSCVYGPMKVVSGQLQLWCGRPSSCSQPHSGYNHEVQGA